MESHLILGIEQITSSLSVFKNTEGKGTGIVFLSHNEGGLITYFFTLFKRHRFEGLTSGIKVENEQCTDIYSP